MNFTSPGFCLFVIACGISFASPLLEDEKYLDSAPTAGNFGKRIRSDASRKRKRISDAPDIFDATDPRYSKLAPSSYLPPTDELKPFSTVQDPQLSFPTEPQASSIDAQAAQAPEIRLAARTDVDESAKDDQCAHSFHSFLCRKPGNGGNRRLKVKQPIAPEASFSRPTKLKPPSPPKITTTSQKPALEESNAEFGASFIQPARVNPPTNTPNCSSTIHGNTPQIPLPYFSTTFPPRVSPTTKQKNIFTENNERPYRTRQPDRKPISADATFEQPSRLPLPVLDHKNCSSKEHSVTFKPVPTTPKPQLPYRRRQPDRKPISADSTFEQPSRLPLPVLDHKNCSSKEHSVIFKPVPTTPKPQLRLNHKNCSTHNPENVDVQATFLNSAQVVPPEEIKPIVSQPPTITLKKVEHKDQVSRDHPFHSVLCKTENNKGHIFPVRKEEPVSLTGDSSFVDSLILLPPSTTVKPRSTTTTTIRVPTTEKLIEPQAAQNPPSVIVPVNTNHDHDHHGRDICSDPFHSFLCQTVDPRNRRRKYGKSPSISRPTLEETNPTGDNTFVYSERVAPPSSTVRPTTTTDKAKTFFQPESTTTYSPVIVPRLNVNTPSLFDIIPKNKYETTQSEIKQKPCDHSTTPFPDRSLSLPSRRNNYIADTSSQFLNKLPIQNKFSTPLTTTTTTTTTTLRPVIRFTTPPFIFHPDGSICTNPNEHLPEVPKLLDPAASFINAENVLPARLDSLRPTTTTLRTTTRLSTTTKQSEVEPQAAQNPETIVRQNNPEHDHEHHHHHHHEGDICKDPFHSFLCEPVKPRRRFDGKPQSSARNPSFERGPALRGDSSFTQTVKLPPPLPVATTRNAPTSINGQIDFTLPSRISQTLPTKSPTAVNKIEDKIPPSQEAVEPTNQQTVILFKDIPNVPEGSSSNQLFGNTGYSYPRPQNELNYPERVPVSNLRRLSRNSIEQSREVISSNAFDSTTQKSEKRDQLGTNNNESKFRETSNIDDLTKESKINNGKPIRWSWSPSGFATS